MQNNAPQLGSRNLQILEDQLNHEALATKKAERYTHYLTDPALKSVAQTLSQQHRQRYERLFGYLSSHQ